MTDRGTSGTSSPPDDPDGVRIVAGDPSGRRSRMLYQGVALFLAAGCVGYALSPRRSSLQPPRPSGGDQLSEMDNLAVAAIRDEQARDEAAAKSGTQVAAAKPGETPAKIATASGRSITPRQRREASKRPVHDPADDPPLQDNDLAAHPGLVPPGANAGDVIQALRDAGIDSGIAAFGLPGTSPPLEGLAVPPGYELPEGYVAHGQATDDGQPIDPILMFNDAYDFFDDNGNPISIPENRVVPPELAPPGFPIRQVEIPQPREPGNTAR